MLLTFNLIIYTKKIFCYDSRLKLKKKVHQIPFTKVKIKVYRKRELDEEELASGQLFLTAFSGYVISRKSLAVHTGKPGDTDCMKTAGYIFIILDRSILDLSATFYYLISTKSKKMGHC